MASPSSNYGADLATTAQKTGESAINSFDPTSVANTQKQSYGDLFNTQSGQSNDFVKRYADTVAGNPDVRSLYDQANQQYGVPGLAKTANYYQNVQTNAIPDAYQATRGTDISNSQVQNGVANKLAYITPQSNAATTNLQTAQGLAAGQVQAGIQQNEFNLLPVQAQQDFLAQQQAAQSTGWTQANSSEFQSLIAKMQSGVSLSQSEMDRANALAKAESDYQSALATTQAANRYQTVAPGTNLVDTFANSIINPANLVGNKAGAHI